jgi:hypothetical protein
MVLSDAVDIHAGRERKLAEARVAAVEELREDLARFVSLRPVPAGAARP